jgi:hypothetical protein
MIEAKKKAGEEFDIWRESKPAVQTWKANETRKTASNSRNLRQKNLAREMETATKGAACSWIEDTMQTRTGERTGLAAAGSEEENASRILDAGTGRHQTQVRRPAGKQGEPRKIGKERSTERESLRTAGLSGRPAALKTRAEIATSSSKNQVLNGQSQTSGK